MNVVNEQNTDKNIIPEERSVINPIIDIPDVNSFTKTISPSSVVEPPKLNSNTCDKILQANQIINSKYPYPSQFPNLTKIKTFQSTPQSQEKPDEVKSSKDVKRGGKKVKVKSRSNSKRIKKNKSSKKYS
jgi:hypothetical protein